MRVFAISIIHAPCRRFAVAWLLYPFFTILAFVSNWRLATSLILQDASYSVAVMKKYHVITGDFEIGRRSFQPIRRILLPSTHGLRRGTRLQIHCSNLSHLFHLQDCKAWNRDASRFQRIIPVKKFEFTITSAVPRVLLTSLHASRPTCPTVADD